MTLRIIEDFNAMTFEPWGGAVRVWERIYNEGKVDEFESLMEEQYPNGIDRTALNDILAFDSDWVLNSLGIGEEEEDEDEDEDEDE